MEGYRFCRVVIWWLLVDGCGLAIITVMRKEKRGDR